MPRVVHFELAFDDAARAKAFYENVFGWSVTQWGGMEYWLLGTGDPAQPGINGGLMQRQENWPSVVNTIDIESVDETVAAITANGGEVVVPKMAVAGVGYLAYCRDTEGNVFGVMQADPSAHD